MSVAEVLLVLAGALSVLALIGVPTCLFLAFAAWLAGM